MIGPGDLLARVGRGLRQVLEPNGWRRSPIPFDAFPGRSGSGSIIAGHHDFAAGLRGTRAMGGRRVRTGTAAGVPSITDLRVRFLARIRPDGAIDDEIAALTDEVLLVDAGEQINSNPLLTSVAGDIAMRVTFREVVARLSAVPESGGAGFFFGEVAFDVAHLYPLGSSTT